MGGVCAVVAEVAVVVPEPDRAALFDEIFPRAVVVDDAPLLGLYLITSGIRSCAFAPLPSLLRPDEKNDVNGLLLVLQTLLPILSESAVILKNCRPFSTTTACGDADDVGDEEAMGEYCGDRSRVPAPPFGSVVG